MSRGETDRDTERYRETETEKEIKKEKETNTERLRQALGMTNNPDNRRGKED